MPSKLWVICRGQIWFGASLLRGNVNRLRFSCDTLKSKVTDRSQTHASDAGQENKRGTKITKVYPDNLVDLVSFASFAIQCFIKLSSNLKNSLFGALPVGLHSSYSNSWFTLE